MNEILWMEESIGGWGKDETEWFFGFSVFCLGIIINGNVCVRESVSANIIFIYIFGKYFTCIFLKLIEP